MLISVIVPLYKGQKFVAKIIKMIQRNIENIRDNDIHGEIIFVNDYPEEVIVMQNHVSGFIAVKCLNNQTNSGIHTSKLKGLKVAEGEYILFLDQDDTIDDLFLVQQLKVIGNHDAVFCNGYWREGEPIFNSMDTTEFNFEQYLDQGYPLISLGQLFIKKNAIPEAWKSNALIHNGWDDHFLWACLMYHEAKISYNHLNLYTHEEDGTNESLNWPGMIQSGVELKESFPRLFPLTDIQKQKFDQVIEGTLMKYRKYHRLDELWGKVSQASIKDYFEKNGYRKVAVYGMGIYGKRLCRELEAIGIDVLYGIDKNAHNKNLNIPVYPYHRKDIYTDLMICATGFDDEKMKKNFIEIKSVTLYEMLYSIYSIQN